ncbi:MAG: ATP-binding protein [Candidatus Babeliales bacterium]
MIKRFYDIEKYLKPNKALIIFGPRQAGKTTLLNNFLSTTTLKYRIDSGDNIRLQMLLGSQDFDKILGYAEGYELIAIDEAQEIPHIGKALKILVDQVPNVHIIATGSSSFDLAQSVGEPLTGRKETLTLYPVAQVELLSCYNRSELQEKLEDFLIFGSYPRVLMAPTRQEKIGILTELVDSYLLKDILALENIKKSDVLLNLVKLLAFQVGQLVSLNELATQLRIDVKTVGRYLDLLEKSFVICSLCGFSSNLRSEVTGKRKYYFLDLGIRNAVIAHFNALDTRNDIGQLWENFVFIERLKSQTYKNFYGRRYFWRTYQGQEIDFIEEIENTLTAFETKWSPTKKVSVPPAWKEMYPESPFTVITSENYLDYIT